MSSDAAAALLRGRIHVEQPLHDFARDQRLGDDLRHVLDLDLVVEHALRQDRHQRAHLAKALAAALVQAQVVPLASPAGTR